jgi:hypothetical protein
MKQPWIAALDNSSGEKLKKEKREIPASGLRDT